MLRRLLQPFWILLAIVFLIEAWLWRHLEPIVESIVARIPFKAFKLRLAAWIETVPPSAAAIGGSTSPSLAMKSAAIPMPRA